MGTPLQNVNTDSFLLGDISATLRSHKFDPELPAIEIQNSIEFNGCSHQISLSRFGPKRSISVKLDENFRCDGHDLCAAPLSYYLHLYTGATRGRTVPFEEKHERMKKWQNAILVFNSIMRPDIETASIETLTKALHCFTLPAADIAVIDTGNPSLIAVLEALNFTVGRERPYPFVIKWKELVSAAENDMIVSEWLKYKRMED